MLRGRHKQAIETMTLAQRLEKKRKTASPDKFLLPVPLKLTNELMNTFCLFNLYRDSSDKLWFLKGVMC